MSRLQARISRGFDERQKKLGPVALAAARDILDRNGIGRPERELPPPPVPTSGPDVTVNVTSVRVEKSDDVQLDNLIRMLEAIGVDATMLPAEDKARLALSLPILSS